MISSLHYGETRRRAGPNCRPTACSLWGSMRLDFFDWLLGTLRSTREPCWGLKRVRFLIVVFSYTTLLHRPSLRSFLSSLFFSLALVREITVLNRSIIANGVSEHLHIFMTTASANMQVVRSKTARKPTKARSAMNLSLSCLNWCQLRQPR